MVTVKSTVGLPDSDFNRITEKDVYVCSLLKMCS